MTVYKQMLLSLFTLQGWRIAPVTSIFLSHNWADKHFTRRLARDLREAGARVWLDEAEIKFGDSLIRKIREGIDSVEYVGVVLSPDSVQSEWVQREVDIAMNQEIDGKKVKVIPIMHKPCDLPGFLKGKLYADMTSDERYAIALPKLFDRLELSAPVPRAQTAKANFNVWIRNNKIFIVIASVVSIFSVAFLIIVLDNFAKKLSSDTSKKNRDRVSCCH